MLRKEVTTRIAPELIKCHKFFKAIDFSKLIMKQIRPPFMPERSEINPLINISLSFLNDKIKDSESASKKIQSLNFNSFSILPGDSLDEGSLAKNLK